MTSTCKRPFWGFIVIATAACCLVESARADEPLFGYVYTTDLLPAEAWEVEQWLTWRTGKALGSFNAVEASTEVQYGWTDAVQLAGYLNYEWAEAHDDNVINATTLPPGAFANVEVGPHERFHLTKFTGISGELIYRILSPYLDPLGLAVYFKPTVGPGLRELNSRLILQKNFLDDRLALAFNATMVQKTRFLRANPIASAGSTAARDRWEEASGINFGIGASYRFIANWSGALEFHNEREWVGINPFSSKRRTDSAYYIGPSLHYADEHVFATLTVLSQLPWASDFANPEPDFVVGGLNYAGNFERFRVRLKFGYYFGGQA
jgi:hypothetical protein